MYGLRAVWGMMYYVGVRCPELRVVHFSDALCFLLVIVFCRFMEVFHFSEGQL